MQRERKEERKKRNKKRKRERDRERENETQLAGWWGGGYSVQPSRLHVAAAARKRSGRKLTCSQSGVTSDAAATSLPSRFANCCWYAAASRATLAAVAESCMDDSSPVAADVASAVPIAPAAVQAAMAAEVGEARPGGVEDSRGGSGDGETARPARARARRSANPGVRTRWTPRDCPCAAAVSSLKPQFGHSVGSQADHKPQSAHGKPMHHVDHGTRRVYSGTELQNA